jgi:hypothetical protein
MIFQSCVAYRPPIALEEAAEQAQKTRVSYHNDVIHRFQYLDKKDMDYYGVNQKKGELIKTKIDSNQIRNVRVYNRSRSVTATILTPIVLTGAIVGIVFVSFSSGSFL